MEHLPYRIKAARLQMGFSQQELGDMIERTKQAVSQYESGKKNPDSSVLVSLSKVLGKNLDYFFRPVRTQLKHVEFRKRASLNGKKLEAVKCSIIEKIEPYLEVEEILNASIKFNNPLEDLVIDDTDDAENAANQLLERWNLGLNPIPNIIEMLEDMGIKVIELSIDTKLDGMSTYVDGYIPIIVLNSNRDILRKRFTALHELGHILLNIPDHISDKECELICNRFASALLLPSDVILNDLGGWSRTRVALNELITIKEYQGASVASIVYRLKDLGIIKDSYAKSFWIMRRKNPMEDGWGEYKGEEKSKRFEQLLFRAVSTELISLSKAASLAGTDIETISKIYKPI